MIYIIFYYFRLFKSVFVKTDLESFDFIGEVILKDCTGEFAISESWTRLTSLPLKILVKLPMGWKTIKSKTKRKQKLSLPIEV